MNGFYENIRMDMIALESAIDLFEVENGITSDYLASDVSYDIEDEGFATESATNSEDVDDSFAGLFGDMPAMEDASEGGEAPKEKFGDKLKKGIMNVLNSIKNFFIKLGEGIANLWSKITKKKKEAENIELTPAEQSIVDQATDVRNAVKSAISILGNTLKADGGKMDRIVKQINQAIKDAKVRESYRDYMKAKNNNDVTGTTKASMTSETKFNLKDGYTKTTVNAGGDKYDRAEDLSKAMTAMGKSYGANKNHISIDVAEKTAEEIAEGTKKMKEAMDIIKSKYIALCERLHKMTKAPEAPEKGLTETDEEFRQRQADHNKSKAKHDGSDIDNKYDYDKITDPVAKVRSILMKFYYHQDANFFTEAKRSCDIVANECKKHSALCKSLGEISKDINQDNDNAKIAFRLCKVYYSAANSFSSLTQYISMISTGSIFAKNKENEHAIDFGKNGKVQLSSSKDKDFAD